MSPHLKLFIYHKFIEHMSMEQEIYTNALKKAFLFRFRERKKDKGLA